MWINLTEAQQRVTAEALGLFYNAVNNEQTKGVIERAAAKIEMAQHDSYRGKQNERK